MCLSHIGISSKSTIFTLLYVVIYVVHETQKKSGISPAIQSTEYHFSEQ